MAPSRTLGAATSAGRQPGGDGHGARDPHPTAAEGSVARRPGAGDDARPLPAGDGPAGGRRPPAPRATGGAAEFGVAGPGPTGRPPRERARWPRPTGASTGTAGGRRRGSWRSVSPCVVPTAFALLAPDVARLSAARWLGGSNERWPQRTYLTVTGLGEGDRLLAPRDEPFALEVRADLPDDRAPGRRLGRSPAAASRSRSDAGPAGQRHRPRSGSASGRPRGRSTTP